MIRSVLLVAFLTAGTAYLVAHGVRTSPTTAPVPAASTILPLPSGPASKISNWTLLFSDEFDGVYLDQTKWTTCYWWENMGCSNTSNNQLEWYLPDNVLVSNGTVKLLADRRTIVGTDGETYPYTSGMITTGRNSSKKALPPKFIFLYGYAEIMAKIPRGKGLWPAFWMLPESHDSKPEIDVMEILGDKPNKIHMALHYRNSDGSADQSGGSWIGPDFSAGWHTFGIWWEPDQIVWYVDGIPRRRSNNSRHISKEPMYLLLNLAIGGDWPGTPDSATPFPSYFEIDFVRVWGSDVRSG